VIDMRPTVRLGRIAGIDVAINWSVFVILGVLAWGLSASLLPAAVPGQPTGAYTATGLLVATAFFACVLAHELAHATVARWYGIGVRRITLWLLGGVTVNYHTLSDFRTETGPVLNELLSSSMAGLIATGVVQVDTLAVDGMRLQAAANRGTFRRSERLAMLERAAFDVLERLAAEVNEDPAAAQRRTTARRLAVAQDRARRLEKAREAQAEIERQREEQRQKQRRKEQRKDHKEARASTVDPEARIMKMADGGFRPAYNVQFKTAAEGAQQAAIAEKERVHLETAQLLADARTSLEEAKALLENAPSGKGSQADIAAMKADLAVVETSLTEADSALAASDLSNAKAKIQAALNATTKVKTAVEQAQAMRAAGTRSRS